MSDADRIYQPLSSESNFPKLIRTTFGFPSRGSLSVSENRKKTCMEIFTSLYFNTLSHAVIITFSCRHRWLGSWRQS
ncbi:hypothetical protein GOODEAATRI_024952 [Goodea atripinnis]|uniref:Uncharacterized protein n=1 Tax=Goodea atripinnis TaxID=208336 RepID=A0ABV0P7N2_9TELE